MLRDDGTIETTTLIPVITLAGRVGPGEGQVYEERVSVVVPSTPEEVGEMWIAVEEMLAEIETARRKRR